MSGELRKMNFDHQGETCTVPVDMDVFASLDVAEEVLRSTHLGHVSVWVRPRRPLVRKEDQFAHVSVPLNKQLLLPQHLHRGKLVPRKTHEVRETHAPLGVARCPEEQDRPK